MKPAPPVTRNRLLIKFSNTEGRHERFKKRKTRVLFGDHGVRRSNRPWDRQVGVVPPKASIAGWRVEVINFIGDLGICNCSPPGGYVDCTRDAPARVRRIASRAPMER